MRLGTALRLTRPFTLLAPTVGVVCGARVATAATGIETDTMALVMNTSQLSAK